MRLRGAQPQPNDVSHSSKAGLISAKTHHVTDAYSTDFSKVGHRCEFNCGRAGLLPHANQLFGHMLASGHARERSAAKKLFNGVQSGVVHTLTECDVDGVRSGIEMYWKH